MKIMEYSGRKTTVSLICVIHQHKESDSDITVLSIYYHT